MYDVNKTVMRIKQIAKEKNIKTTIMIQELGLAKNTLSSMSSRGSWIQANSLAMIADYLDCSVDYLLGRTDELSLNQGTVIQAGDVSGNIIAGDINGNHNANINTGIPEDISEMVELIQSLPLIKRAEAILMLNRMKTEE